MYIHLARFLALRPRKILAFWIFVVIASALIALTGFGNPLWNRLISDVPQATPSESNTGQKLIESQMTTSYGVMAYVEGVDLRGEVGKAEEIAKQLDELKKQAEDQGDEAKALGDEAKAAGDPAKALGDQAKALGNQATALANRAKSLGNQAQALGDQAREAGARAQELKTQAENTGAQAQVAGAKAQELKPQAESAAAKAQEAGAKAQAAGAKAKGLQAQAEAAAAKAQAAAATGDLAAAAAAQKEAETLGAQAKTAGEAAGQLATEAATLGANAQDLGAQAQAAGAEAQRLADQAQDLGAQAAAAGAKAQDKAGEAERLGAQATRLGSQAKTKGNEAKRLGDAAKDKGDIAQNLADRAKALGDQAKALGDQAKALSEPEWPVAKSLNTALKDIETRLKKIPEVKSVTHPFVEYNAMLDPLARELVAKNQKGFVFVVTLDLTDGGEPSKTPSQEMLQVVREVEDIVSDVGPTVSKAIPADAKLDNFRARITDQDLVNSAGIETLKTDLVRAESIGIPLSFLIMAIVFGGFLAALLPLGGAGVAISTSLALMLGMTYIFEQQSFAVNVISILGLGLSIDYGLLIVSRFREELARLKTLPEEDWLPDFSTVRNPKKVERLKKLDPRHLRALEISLSTAGRTAFFSALTVAIASSGMLFFKAELLKSLGIAGFSVVLLAMIASLTLVSALMFMFATKLEKPSVLGKIPGLRRLVEAAEPEVQAGAQAEDTSKHSGKKPLFDRIAIGITRRPWLSFILSAAVLVAACLPLSYLPLRNSLFDLLPIHNEQRLLYEDLADQVPRTGLPPLRVVAVDTPPEELDQWMEEQVANLEGVDKVFNAAKLGETGNSVAVVQLETDDPGSYAAEDVVKEVRAQPHDFDRYVVGQAANQIDFIDSLVAGLPWVLTVLISITFVLLFTMTGSVVIPIQALVINTLSLMATLGISTLVFVDGFGVELLGAKQLPGLESYVVVMLMCFGFGLSMDYELFLLSRMKEVWDETASAKRSVIEGLSRSGRIVTSAATILVFVFLCFITGHMIVLKQVGFILAVAVAFDATIVRMVLVPSVMAIFGRINWWAPGPLRRLHNRFSERLGHLE
ncbi:MAG: MMPL family transporter [Mobiluncus porci]|uniref:MMPL family transporter n=1 Tax=Mobiluncus porci TaxID=2652278 RepID=UPI0023F3EA2A|nr:MMPL family transporter [Mobiluncus porci]MDD7540789.1 MMPL family transporter [Mobiluncus porci]MDY5748981.1 MMPL family transporter [Mobiluncus porci]